MISVKPYHQIDQINFSMSYDDLLKTLGAPQREVIAPNNEKLVFWPEINVEIVNGKIFSIGYNNVANFLINNQSVSLIDHTILKTENPYYSDNTYTFPKWGMSLYNFDDLKNGFEIRFFNRDFENTFLSDQKKLPSFKNLLGSQQKFSKFEKNRTRLEIKPLVGVGLLNFGMSPIDVEKILGAAKDTITIKGELREKRDIGINVTYNKSQKLTQINFENIENVFLNNQDISEKGNLATQFEKITPFINRSYAVYFDLGLAFQNFNNKKGIKTIIVFNEEKFSFWKNVFIPLL